MIKGLVKKIFHKAGFEVTPVHEWSTNLTMAGALARCAKRGTKFESVVDVGASNGSWTLQCMKHFPNAKYLLVEAQEPHRASLEKFCATHPNAAFVVAAAGNSEGKIYFDATDLFGGLASETPLEGPSIEVPVITIDQELKRRNLRGPYAMKLDTHGFEVPILQGASNALKNASLVIIETYNFQVTATSLRYFEMCAYMKDLGFLPIETVDIMRRERDGSLWQMDTFFIPTTSEEFKSNTFD
jgi:FkbM family methyltransferase